jgi:hypothetical protein
VPEALDPWQVAQLASKALLPASAREERSGTLTETRWAEFVPEGAASFQTNAPTPAASTDTTKYFVTLSLMLIAIGTSSLTHKK